MLAETTFPVTDYDLAATLASGQAFRWTKTADGAWFGVIQNRPILLRQLPKGIRATTGRAYGEDWKWVENYLQTEIDLSAILASFPNDPPMQAAIRACHGLRLLRQDPWECLASFILSSTKQIVQIQQIVKSLCDCYGEPFKPWHGVPALASFPSASRLASLTEAQLRSCKMGFRAPYLLKTAQIISSGQLDLESLRSLSTNAAREALCTLPGVGEKIANCVLLFAYGFQDAFPVDVWVQRAITELYFSRPKRKPTKRRLLKFIETHFGPNAGYAQQYLFHYMRTKHEPV